ncbi:unnamed protein product, partial [Polarella glacialis]
QAMRLWRSLPGPDHMPSSLRSYMMRSVAEASTGLVMALAAAEATCFVCASAGDASVGEAWTQLAAVGGVGCILALLPLDSSSMQPQLLQEWDEGHPAIVNLGPASRQALFVAATASAGVLLAPAALLLAATVGDPKSRGHGPLACAGLAAAHLAGQAATLEILPQSWLEGNSSEEASSGHPVTAAAASAVGGWVAAATLGLAIIAASGRDSARRTVILASSCLTVHAALTAATAARLHSLGQAEPLRPALAPVLGLLVKDASGQAYWWNKQSNETTALGAPKPGPDRWQEVKDPSSGQAYWWNKETNQTTAIGAAKPSSLAPAAQAAAPATTGGGLGSALADGMAWGVGTSIAGRMMDGIMGPRQMEVVHRDETGGGGGDAGGAGPPPPGNAGDGGGDLGDQGWSWGDSNSGGGGGDDGGDGGGGWFGGGGDEW